MEIQVCPYLYLTLRLLLYLEEWRGANNYNLPCIDCPLSDWKLTAFSAKCDPDPTLLQT